MYAQLRELIVERIQEGAYVCERIPSEITLCEERASRPTVRQAISELVSTYFRDPQGRHIRFSQPERLMIPHFNALTFSFLNMTSYEGIGLQPVQHIEPDPELDGIQYSRCKASRLLDVAVLVMFEGHIRMVHVLRFRPSLSRISRASLPVSA